MDWGKGKDQWRQGDVLIVPADAIEQGAEVPRENGKIVLAHGEVTGHMHAIIESEVTMIAGTRSRLLQADTPFAVTHDEHSTHHIDAGAFHVISQFEYTPAEIRQVLD